MPRRRQRNRYVEIYDQELSGRPLLHEGRPCARCRLPLLGHHSYDEMDRWVHPDCDQPPERADVASHLLLHEMWDTGLDPEVLVDSMTDAVFEEAIDRYLANWRLARAASDELGRRAPDDSAPLADVRATLAKATPGRTHSRATSTPLAGQSAIMRLKQQIESAPHGRARVAVRVPGYVAVLLARELSDLAIIGAMPEGDIGALTLGVSAESRPAVVDRLEKILRRLPTSD
jgi:hypothetical protein